MSSIDERNEIIEELKTRIALLEKELDVVKQNKFQLMVDAETQCESLTLLDDFNLYKESTGRSDASIADMIRETSETCLSESGYSYEEKTGLYFHSKSGYYYDPINFLFYNPKNGTYYSYDSDTQEYKYHSQANQEELIKLSNEMLWTQGYQHKAPQQKSEEMKFNTGEIVHSEVASCVRIIHEATGKLEIITLFGGSIGSVESKGHAILIPTSQGDVEIDLQVTYDPSSRRYQINSFCENSESQLNGTAITRVPRFIDHHSKLVVKNQSYLVHIHEDYGTCDWCEPGQVRMKLDATQSLAGTEQLEVKKPSSKRVINQLKIKYGLKGGNGFRGNWKQSSTNELGKYVDRAQMRRNAEKLNEKSKITKSENTALKMMSKMGWNPGESLGRAGTGIIEPITVNQRLNSRAGIGSEHSINVGVETDYRTVRKLKNQQSLQNRYNSLFNK